MSTCTRALDLARLSRTFSLRTNEGFVENFGPALIALGAKVKLVSAKGSREVAVEKFFVAPANEQAREFENEMEMNLSHLDRAVGNFRINIFWQRNSIAIVVRYILGDIPPLDVLAIFTAGIWLSSSRRRSTLRKRLS